jgi:AcrR family transcriptional regulator
MAREARPPLTRDAIVDAALALVDEGGLEALSMRAIGGRLGVQAMSLYHHVPNKAALLDAVHERLILSIELDLGDEEWTQALRGLAHAYRALALAHPQAFVLLATRPLTSAAAVAHVLPALDRLALAGFGPRQRMVVIQVFFTALNGILLAEVAPVPGHADLPEPDTTAAYRELRAGGDTPALPDDLADFLQDRAEELQIAAWFGEAIELILRGLRTLAPDPAD